MSERICAAFIPFIAVVEALILAMSRCFDCRHESEKGRRRSSELSRLSSETRCKVFSLALGRFFLQLILFDLGDETGGII